MKIVFLSTILFHGAVWAASSQVQSLRQHQQQEQNESIGTLESNELLQGRILQPERTGPAPEVCDRFLADPIKDTTTFPETKSNNIPAVKPFCLTFDEGLGTQGFAPCPGVYNNIIVQQSVSNTNGDPTFGPSAGGIDFYLHQVDQSGGSLGCGTGSDYTGDWSAMACEDGCHEICFDFRVLYDGCNGTLRCLVQTATATLLSKRRLCYQLSALSTLTILLLLSVKQVPPIRHVRKQMPLDSLMLLSLHALSFREVLPITIAPS